MLKLSLLMCLIGSSYLTEGSKSPRIVTYGSIIKLLNQDYGYRLHSHDVKYGSGSGQQSTTGIELKEDVNSHWLIKTTEDKFVQRGEPVKCGDVIRLEHLTTKRNLHSHMFSSPLSGEQEISCYGNSGEGDSGDSWQVVCGGEVWNRDLPVRFKHRDTSAYLGMSGRTFGRPISGQMEVVGFSSAQHGTKWTTAEGLFISPNEEENLDQYAHTEL